MTGELIWVDGTVTERRRDMLSSYAHAGTVRLRPRGLKSSRTAGTGWSHALKVGGSAEKSFGLPPLDRLESYSFYFVAYLHVDKCLPGKV